MCTGIERSAPIPNLLQRIDPVVGCSSSVQVFTSCQALVDRGVVSTSLAHPAAQVACVILSLTAKLSLLLVGSALVVVGAIANVIGPALMAAGRAAFEASGSVGGDC